MSDQCSECGASSDLIPVGSDDFDTVFICGSCARRAEEDNYISDQMLEEARKEAKAQAVLDAMQGRVPKGEPKPLWVGYLDEGLRRGLPTCYWNDQ